MLLLGEQGVRGKMKKKKNKIFKNELYTYFLKYSFCHFLFLSDYQGDTT